MHTKILDLRDVVAEMVSMLQRLIDGNVELTTVLPDEPALIRADRVKIEQVIANLALNARDAMPDGGHLVIEVDQAHDARRALLVVRDDGLGMEASTVAQIFEPFFTTKGADGTGLGLSMVHGIVSQSGGEIVVDSEPGRGTTFTISLPLAEGEALPDTVAAAAADGRRRDDPPGRGRRRRQDRRGEHARAARLWRAHGGKRRRGGGAGGRGPRHDRPPRHRSRHARPERPRDRRAPSSNIRRVRRCSTCPATPTTPSSGSVVSPPGVSFIQKPFTGEELARHVRELLDAA